jgi:hypothetical protein
VCADRRTTYPQSQTRCHDSAPYYVPPFPELAQSSTWTISHFLHRPSSDLSAFNPKQRGRPFLSESALFVPLFFLSDRRRLTRTRLLLIAHSFRALRATCEIRMLPSSLRRFGGSACGCLPHKSVDPVFLFSVPFRLIQRPPVLAFR